MAEQSADAPAPRRSAMRRAFHIVRNFLALIGLAFLIYSCCFDVSEIVSGSMQPALRGDHTGNPPDDWILSEKITRWFRKPRRFEIVQFRNDDSVSVMKRVVGLPGEKVSVQDNFLVINGQPIARPADLQYLNYLAIGKLFNGKEADCGANGYFVLGDDSKDSEDSRYEGPVDGSRIRGRAWLIVWPPARMGFVR